MFVELLRSLQADPHTTIIAGTPERFAAGCERFGDRPDKDWSLTDCLSFLVMEELGIMEEFTADHHFEQEGFDASLQP